MDFSFVNNIVKKDILIFFVSACFIYIAYNVYRKQNELEPNYIQSLQISVVLSTFVVILWKYNQTTGIEDRLDEPFKSSS